MDDPKRAKRVGQIKKLIVALLMIGVLLPISVCILLVVKVYDLQDKVDALTDELVATSTTANRETTHQKEVNLVFDETSDTQIEQAQTEAFSDLGKKENNQTDQATGEETVTKVYLTFDDGPSSNTGEILDILKEYDVKATFFVIGRTEEQFAPLYQRIVEEGHTLGMHSYSHKYNEIYASEENFWKDLGSLQDFLYDTTGKWPRFYRFPGGSSNQVSRIDMQSLTRELRKQDIQYLDWNISSGDATGVALGATQIANNVTNNILQYQTAVVLMHDAADKHSTVEGLRLILERLTKMEQVQILPVTDEMEFVVHLY